MAARSSYVWPMKALDLAVELVGIRGNGAHRRVLEAGVLGDEAIGHEVALGVSVVSLRGGRLAGVAG